jgi:hypothetical protein
MSRTIPALVTAQLGSGTVRCAILAELNFAGGYFRAWTGVGSLSYDSKTWTGIGDLGGVSLPEETGDGSANGFSLTLSGIPSSSISAAFTEVYRGRSAKIWLAFFNAAWVMIDVIQLAAGRMDTMSINETGETSSITVSCENRLIDLDRPRERRLTDKEQQRRFPGDTGCRYVASIVEKPLYWGVENKVVGPKQ